MIQKKVLINSLPIQGIYRRMKLPPRGLHKLLRRDHRAGRTAETPLTGFHRGVPRISVFLSLVSLTTNIARVYFFSNSLVHSANTSFAFDDRFFMPMLVGHRYDF